MTPLFFEGRFGWLHPAGRGGGLGVVLCPAFAQEEVCTHHGLMLLAERLAAAGLPTLRFDYRGTGDSEDGAVTVAGLVDDAVRAAAVLRRETGVARIALVGLRLGAAAAVRAAAMIDGVAAVALLAPVVDGRAYLRETRAAAGFSPLAQLDPVPAPQGDAPLNTNGFAWSGALQREIAALALDGEIAPAPQVFVARVRTDRRAAAWAAAVARHGAAVVEHPFADYDTFMQDPTIHLVPEATFARLAAWLAARAGETGGVAMPGADLPVEVAPGLAGEGFEETPCRFGPGDRVFGMLCRPTSAAPRTVAVLLLHEGSSHHIGNGRAYVALARRLARAGIASLRMDLSGLGDSPAAEGAPRPFFEAGRRSEALAGVELLAAAGYPRVAAAGLCSGAHLALQVGLADERVVGLCLTNLPRFLWREGDDLRQVRRDSKRSLRSYVRSLRSPAAWTRALRGDGDLGGIARVVARRAAAGMVRAIRDRRPPPPGSPRAVVHGQMRRLADRGVATLMILTDEDMGLAEMTAQFGRGARGLRAFAPARMIVLPRADHHFNAVDARRRHTDLIEAMLLALG